MTTKLTYERLARIIRNLDLHSRIYLGQYDEILYHITGRILYSSVNIDLNHALCNIRDMFIPSLKCLSMNSSLGIWGDHTPLVAIRSYDIQQCLRYQLAYYRSNGKDMYTVNYRVPFIYGEWGMAADDVNRNHRILEDHNLYPDFRKGYACRYVWACPVIITRFDKDYVDVELSDEVQKIIETADKVMQLVGEKKITDVFRLLYPEVPDKDYMVYTEYVENYFRNREGWSK